MENSLESHGETYRQGVCWWLYKDTDKICGLPCGKYKVIKNLQVQMWLCEKHKKRMEKYGYFITRCD